MKTLRLPFLLLPSLAMVAPMPLAAQDGDLLVIERKEDRAGRDRLLRKLKRTRVTISFHDTKAEDVASYLTVAAGKGITFLVASRTVKPDELPILTLALKKVRLDNAMSIISMKNDLRFVYRGGVVFIRPKDEVKEFTFLRLYDVRAATMKMPNFPAPRLGLTLGDEGNFDDPDEDDGATTSGFDTDKLVDMIRNHVLPESWDDKASITQMNGVLAIRHTESGHKKVRSLLVQLGAVPPIRYRILGPRPRPYIDYGRIRSRKPAEKALKKATKKAPTKKAPAKKKPATKTGR